MRRRGIGRRGPGLLGTIARTAVVAGTASTVAGGVAQRQQEGAHRRREHLDAQEQLAEQQRRAEVDAQVAAALAAQQPAVPVGPAVPVASAALSAGDVIAQLTQLGELRAAGVLTEEEFAAQKARVLGT